MGSRGDMEGNWLENIFIIDDRLGIHIPIIDKDWDSDLKTFVKSIYTAVGDCSWANP